jgi:hypothetical protein
MRKLYVRAFGALIWAVGTGALLTGVAHPAAALGASVYRTDDDGTQTSTVIQVGSTGPACCCVWDGNGDLHLGVRVCYLPA